MSAETFPYVFPWLLLGIAAVLAHVWRDPAIRPVAAKRVWRYLLVTLLGSFVAGVMALVLQ